jgi:hypothetical protein
MIQKRKLGSRSTAALLTVPGIRRFLCALAVMMLPALSAAPAFAQQKMETEEVAGEEFALPVPDSYCIVDRDHRRDGILFESMRRALAPTNDLVAYWIDCDDFVRLKSGKSENLGRYILVMSGNGKESPRRLPGVARPVFIRMVADLYASPEFLASVSEDLQDMFAERDFSEVFVEDLLGEDTNGSLEEGKAEFERLRQEIIAGRMNFFPLGSDGTAAYLGYSIPGDTAVIAGVGALTLIREIPLTFVVYDLQTSSDIYKELHKEAGGIALAAILANEPT